MIPFVNLQAQYRTIQDKVETAVLAALRSGQYIMGREVVELEERLAAYCGSKHAISCASGTDALVMALMAKGVGPGDAIFTTPFTFFATAEAIALVGATPVFVDVERDTFNIDPAALKAAIEKLAKDGTANPAAEAGRSGLTPKGIIAVDLFGLPANYRSINEIAERHDLFVIEDAAQSFGAKMGTQRAGALAEIGCTSFFPAKPLGCYGDGGAIFTDSTEIADRLKSIRVHGQGADRYEHVRIGLTGRLDTVQAAVLIEKLAIFDEELQARQAVANGYRDRIDEAGLPLTTPVVADGFVSAWAQYTVVAPDEASRDLFRKRLSDAEIPTAVYYPKPLHLQPAFKGNGGTVGAFPVSEDLSRRVFSLPMHPYLSDEQVAQIVAAMTGT
jgi:dTDP-4-amino-4,6-dideoxygalactose transaminase